MADPYWGVSLSRRWQLFERGPIKGFFGFGLAGKTKSDELSTTRWDFASQLGVRFRLPGNRVTGEPHHASRLVERWHPPAEPRSGISATLLTINLNSGLFGVSKDDQVPLDPTLDTSRALAANHYGYNYGSEMELLP